MAKTSTGLEPNVAGVLCYVLFWVTGIVFFLLEKKNSFVRFHAMQSIVTFGGLTVINIVAAMLPVIGSILGPLIGLLSIALWVVLMVKAWQNERFLLPVAGDLAEKWAKEVTL